MKKEPPGSLSDPVDKQRGFKIWRHAHPDHQNLGPGGRHQRFMSALEPFM